jgi:hypothetical protein
MCARGLLMLLQCDKLRESNWMNIAFELVKGFNNLFETSNKKELPVEHMLM